MSKSEGQHILQVLETMLKRLDFDGLNMCRGETVDIFVEGCSKWRYQAGGKENDLRGDHGCSGRGYADSWFETRRYRGQRKVEEDDLLW